MIVSIVYQTEKSVQKQPYRFNRIPAHAVNLIAGYGIEGDRKAGRNPKRQLNIMFAEQLDVLNAEGYRTAPGEMGEQIVLSGIDFSALHKGSQIQLGEQAVIELTMLREPCAWFEKVQGKPKADAVGRVGYMARVLSSGSTVVGDSVRLWQGEPKR